jgi:hypothetical protein
MAILSPSAANVLMPLREPLTSQAPRSAGTASEVAARLLP